MGAILYVGKSGYENPARAAMPFRAASEAIDRGQQPAIVLMDDAVYLVKDEVADVLEGAGLPPFRQLMDKAVEHGVPIYLCGQCSTARGITDADCVAKNGQMVGPGELASLTAQVDKVLSF